MSASFTPSTAIDMSNERTWAADLGMLDWDSTNIVFTKRSLIEFLKHTGVTVDTNFAAIAKLPRYAKFGKLSQPSTIQAPDSDNAGQGGTNDAQASGQDKSSSSHSHIFGNEDSDDALSSAPTLKQRDPEPTAPAAAADSATSLAPPQFRTSRRVRTSPGGDSTIGSLFGSEDTPAEFKPTRKVREGPGGQDHFGSIF